MEYPQYRALGISSVVPVFPLKRKKPNFIQVLVIGRYFPPPRGTAHPVAQFNITYAYSIVSQRCRRNRKGLCTPARLTRDAPEGQKLALLGNFLRFHGKFPAELSFQQVTLYLTIVPRFTATDRDADFRFELRCFCYQLTRNADTSASNQISSIISFGKLLLPKITENLPFFHGCVAV